MTTKRTRFPLDDLLASPTAEFPASRSFQNLNGRVFGRLTVVRYLGPRGDGSYKFWECHCECGNRTATTSRQLVSGQTTSCGCYKLERTASIRFRHGRANSAEYKIWAMIKGACNNKNHSSYPVYGAKGISIGQEWATSFEKFFEDVGPRPSDKHVLRPYQSGNGNFSSGNAGWVLPEKPAGKWHQENNDALREMVVSGKRQDEIAQHFAVSVATIQKQVRGMRESGIDLVVQFPLNPVLAEIYPARTREEAISLGHKMFYNGRLCPKGHDEPRRINSRSCPECARMLNRDYHEKQAKSIRSRKRSNYVQNQDRELARGKRYRESNPEKVKAWAQVRRARVAGAEGNHTPDDILRILEMQRYKCAYCSKSLKKWRYHVDHIVPLSKGGSNWPSNLQALCQFCNCSKNASDPIDFAQSIGLLI